MAVTALVFGTVLEPGDEPGELRHGLFVDLPALLDRGQPVTALIVTELGEAAAGSPKYHALFLAALILMVVTTAINMLIGVLKKRIIYDAA